MFDVFATGSTPTGMGFDGRIGGSPFNVALGLARLRGHKVAQKAGSVSGAFERVKNWFVGTF